MFLLKNMVQVRKLPCPHSLLKNTFQTPSNPFLEYNLFINWKRNRLLQAVHSALKEKISLAAKSLLIIQNFKNYLYSVLI